MSSLLIRQDLVPIVSGYVLVMAALAAGLLLIRRSGARAADQGRRATRSDAARAAPGPGRPGPGWPRLIRHVAATAAGGYALLMIIVLLYYYGVARVSGQFLASAFSGCALLIGLSLPAFLGMSWLTQRWRQRSGRGQPPPDSSTD